MVKNVRELIKDWQKGRSLIVITRYKTEAEAKRANPTLWRNLKTLFNIDGSKHHTKIGNETKHTTGRGEESPKEIVEGLQKVYPKAKVSYEKDTTAFLIDWT